MESNYKDIWHSALVKVLAILMPLFALHANADGIPAGWESYLDRPDILTVQSVEKNNNKNWTNLKAAHFTFVAQLLASYPADTDIYFLARDSEHLYDVAKLVTQGSKEQNRIHLLNVSRANMRDPNLLGYLGENGISKESIASGRKILFVDTGFAGTIPRVIGELFTLEEKKSFKTQLVVSSNPDHPSSRAFLAHINSAINDQDPSNMHGSIVSYEHMARYTDRSSQYVLQDGRYHPISPIGQSSDGSVSKELSLKIMQDLKAEWNKPERRARFTAELKKLKEIRRILVSGNEGAKFDFQKVLESSQDADERRILEAFTRDSLTTAMKNNTGQNISVTLEELGFKEKATSNINTHQKVFSKKNDLIAKYPEWAPIFENPDDKILELFKDNDWQKIGNLIDLDVDAEINRLIAKNLYDSPATGIKRDLQILFIEKGSSQVHEYLAYSIFSQPHAVEMKDLIKLLIEKGSPETHRYLVERTFSQPHAAEMTDLIKFLIEKGSPETLEYLALKTFSQLPTAETKELIKLLIEKGSDKAHQHLVQVIFSQPHAVEMKDLIRYLIEIGSPKTHGLIAYHTFSRPHAAEMKDLIRYLIEIGSPEALQGLTFDVFSRPHTTKMNDLFKILVEKSSPSLLIFLKSTISKRKLFEDPSGDLKILEESLKISDPAERKDWIDTELGKMKSPPVQNSKSKVRKSFSVTKELSASLNPDDVISVENRKLRVIKTVGEGRRGIVFQVEGENGALYALKVAKDSSVETLSSIVDESNKAKLWQQLKVPHAKVLVQGTNFVLKPFIAGVSGNEVVEKFAVGDMNQKPAADYLMKLVEHIRSKGAYIGDFRPANLIWNGKAWVIVDSGSVDLGLSYEQAKAKWEQADSRGPKFQRRWKMPLPADTPSLKCSGTFM